MNPIFFKIIGIIGLLLISFAMLVKRRRTRDIESIIGGLCLLTYSIYLQDVIFITLQIVYIGVTIFDYIKNKKNA